MTNRGMKRRDLKNGTDAHDAMTRKNTKEAHVEAGTKEVERAATFKDNPVVYR